MPLEQTPAELFPADITPRYLGWLHDPESMRFSNQRFRRHDEQSSLAYLSSFTGSPNLFLAICDRAGGETLGTMTVYAAVPHETADVGILVGERAQWGQGIGREAWCLLVDWLLGPARIRKLTAGCAAGNHGMRSLMEASRMQHEATRHAQEIIDGKAHDLVYYARFRDA